MEEDEDSFELEVFEVDEPVTPDDVLERRVRRHRRRRRAKGSFGSGGPQRSRSSVSVCSSSTTRGDQPLVPPATPETPGGTPADSARPASTFRFAFFLLSPSKECLGCFSASECLSSRSKVFCFIALWVQSVLHTVCCWLMKVVLITSAATCSAF
jgi:hypothetical protein